MPDQQKRPSQTPGGDRDPDTTQKELTDQQKSQTGQGRGGKKDKS